MDRYKSKNKQRIGLQSYYWILVLLILLFIPYLTITGMRQKSATADEPTHILSGYSYLNGDYSINPEHPPFLKMLAALPLLFMVGYSIFVYDVTDGI